MKTENIQFLEDNRHHYQTYQKAQVLTHFDFPTRQRLYAIAKEDLGYQEAGNLWCQSCIADLLVYTYREYDKWLEKQPKEEVKLSAYMNKNEKAALEALAVESENYVMAGSPVADLEGQVKAETFPVHEVAEVKAVKKAVKRNIKKK